LEGRVVARESDPRCPYRASLDTTKFKDGEYALTVKAYDAAGNLAASQTTKVVVDNKPVITILTPRSRQTVSGTFIAKADLSGVLPEGSSRSVKFLIDGVVRGEDSLVKHEPPLAVAIDSTKLSNGAHELVAQSGLHDKGQISSEKVAFRVDNTNPAIFLVDKALVETPWAGIRLKGTAPIEVGVANMEKIIKMELWVDGALMKSNSVYDPNPYAFSLDTTKLTNGAHLITLKAYAGQGWLTALQNTKVVVANAVEGGAK